jgi:transposase
MKEAYAVLVGLDWADQKHDVQWRETDTGQLHTQDLPQTPECIHKWITELTAKYPGRRIAVCLEQSRGAVVYALMGYEAVDLCPVNPVTLADYRNAFRPSGAKDDPSDAGLLLELLERHPEALKVWRPDTEPTRLLRSLCEDRRKAVDLRTGLCHSLRSKLKEYFPQALRLVGEDLFSELCCSFLMKWPRFESVAKARPETIRKFYYAHHSRSEELIQQRLELIATSRSLCTDAAVVEAAILWIQTLVPQIRTLNRAIKNYDQRIEGLFKTHPDCFIFESFPGAGQQLGPRLLTAFGTDRTRYALAVEAANYFGISPVIERSGKQEWVRWRWHCPKFLRQSLVEFAGKSVGFSPWARTYYNQQITRGKHHHAAVRALAFKWIRILFRCWQERTPYDEALYVAALRRHGSWITQPLEHAV